MYNANKDNYDLAMQELAENRSEWVSTKIGEMIRYGSCSYNVKGKGRAASQWETKEILLTDLLLDDDNPEYLANVCSQLFQNKGTGQDIDAVIMEIVEKKLNEIAEEVY